MREMNCQAARELMLEVDLSELVGTGTLARHIESCAPCRIRAQAITSGYRDLDEALYALRPQQVAQHRMRRVRWLALPLAAAAVLVLLPTWREEMPPPPSALLTQLMFPEQPVVTPPPGWQAMVVMERDVTVVWLY